MFKFILIAGLLVVCFWNCSAQNDNDEDICSRKYSTCDAICNKSTTQCSISIYVYPQERRQIEIRTCNGVRSKITQEGVDVQSAMNITCRLENSITDDEDNFVQISSSYSNIYTSNVRNRKK